MTEEILVKIYNIGKWILATLICILIVLTIGVSKLYETNKIVKSEENTEAEYNTLYDVSMFEEIEAKDISSKTKKEKQVIYIGRETCGWCAAFLPALWEAQEDYGYKTLYIDIAKIIDFSANTIIDEDAYNILINLSGDNYEGYMNENFGATPMVLIVEKGKIISAQTGYSEYETFKSVLTAGGY